MNVFEIQGPDGQTYEVEAESIEAAAAAVSSMATPKKPWGQVLKENLFGDDDPNTQNFGEKVGSALNKAGESMTFGLIGDEAGAAIESLVPGVNYEDRRDHYRKQEEVLERDNPGVALAAEIGGAMILPGGMVAGMARAPVTAARAAKAANLGKRVAASAAATGSLSGLYGFAEGEGLQDRVADAQSAAKWGAAIGSTIPFIGAGAQRLADSRAVRQAGRRFAKDAKTTDMAFREASDAYQAVDDLGVEIRAPRFDALRSDLVDALSKRSAWSSRPGAQRAVPVTSGLVDDMARASDEIAEHASPAIPFREIEGFRRQAGAAKVTNRADTQGGQVAREIFDDAIDGLKPEDVVGDDPSVLADAINKARRFYSVARKSQDLDTAIEAAESYRYGFSNGIKWKFREILKSPKKSRGFSDAEKRVMKRVINGTVPERLLETIGSGLTQVGGVIGTGLGVASGGLPAAVAGMGLTGASLAARGASNSIARKNAELARALIVSGKAGDVLGAKASPAVEKLTQQLMRRGTAAAVQ